MKNLQKLLAALLALTMMAGCLTACGSSGSSDDAAAADDTAATEETEAPAEGEAAVSNDTAAATDENGDPVYGGTLTVYNSSLGALPTYEPAVPDFAFYMIWYEQLWTLDWADTSGDIFDALTVDDISGQIADTWEFDSEAQTLTVNIRDDIYFQTLPDEYDYYGGRNLTAADVKYTYDRLFGWDGVPQVQSMMDWSSTLYMLESVETDGDYTVIFHFNTGSEVAMSDFMLDFVNVIGPEWDTLTADQQMDWHYACGTGAYILSDCVEGQYMTFVRNDNYYDYDERHPENKLPYLDGLTLVYTSDSATLQSEFIAGEVDLIGHSEDVFTKSELAQIEDSLDPSEFTEWVTQSTNRCIINKQTCTALQDINVRKALQYAIDMETIAKEFFGYEDGEWYIPSVFSNHYPYASVDDWSDELKAEYYTYDPDLAKQLLTDAGYGDGLTLTMVMSSSGNTDLYMLIKEYWAAVGVDLEFDMLNGNNEVSTVATDPEKDELSMVNMSTSGGLNNTEAYWRSGTSNYRLGGDDTLDAMIDAVNNATTLEEQTELAKAFDQYIMEQHYATVICPTENVTFLSSGKVGGYTGEHMYKYWNLGTVLTRLWNTAGE